MLRGKGILSPPEMLSGELPPLPPKYASAPGHLNLLSDMLRHRQSDPLTKVIIHTVIDYKFMPSYCV